jgi:uncharacterized protein YebE (UPF0316 family)
MGLRWKDAYATLLIAIVGVLSWAYFTDQGWAAVSNPRGLAAVVTAIGLISYVTGTRTISMKLSDLTLVDRIVRYHPLLAIGLAAWAVITGSELALALLLGLIGIRWLGSIIVHAFSPKTPA